MTWITLDTNSVEDYRTFLKVKSLPMYRVRGNSVWFPDEYSDLLGVKCESDDVETIELADHLFDYQAAGATTAIRKRKYAFFWRPGLGKTNPLFEFIRHSRKMLHPSKRCFIVSPSMVIDQTIEEAARFYPEVEFERVEAKNLREWVKGEGGIGITNYESLKPDVEQGNIGMIGLDESSLLKSHYGKWGQVILRLGRGIDWKLCLTGTPAPNDRIEYANHAVFLDRFPNVNSFLARYFVNRGETSNRWEMKPHAALPFYTSMSHWASFINDPGTYGFMDNADSFPPIHIHVDHLEMTPEQVVAYRKLTGNLVVAKLGGIASRSKIARLAKCKEKYDAIKGMIGSWRKDESTIVWCRYNDEQDKMAATLPQAGNIDGRTPHAERMRIIREFKQGTIRTLISKPKIIQFGLNLQVATRHVWSGLQDSYEEFFQGCCRSNRIGSTKPLNVHIPVSDLERPFVDNVLRKADQVQRDIEEQERIFKEQSRCQTS